MNLARARDIGLGDNRLDSRRMGPDTYGQRPPNWPRTLSMKASLTRLTSVTFARGLTWRRRIVL